MHRRFNLPSITYCTDKLSHSMDIKKSVTILLLGFIQSYQVLNTFLIWRFYSSTVLPSQVILYFRNTRPNKLWKNNSISNQHTFSEGMVSEVRNRILFLYKNAISARILLHFAVTQSVTNDFMI